ncbi:hypothetical protein MJO28_002435 [Puccinia striiformis f. sp. tritici]|uniref:Uncharacterized protein n=1 Tax=Puccinia striiformis f. sp. tritici TaxID=168172 RepID=A0ACC0EQN9_9BASI|nr:hypothetical protein MJO28_002435 [Puccinia striiformis f. sp. tritici]
MDNLPKGENPFSEDTSPTFPQKLDWPGGRSLPNASLCNNSEANSLALAGSAGLGRERTPSLLPPLKGLLSSIKSCKERQLAIELAIKLAEERLEIDKLEDSCLILKLLEEECYSRDEFSGISRLSDIITTSRLSAGLGSSKANIAQHATIEGALATSKPILVDGSVEQTSELKRQQCMKRKTWLAATRRLDSRLVGQQEQDCPELQVWPEPIFLKNSN